MQKVKLRLNMLPEQRDLVVQAAYLSGETFSEFVIRTACERANTILKKQPFNGLSDDQFKLINQSLDQFIPENQRIRRLMRIKAPWLKN